MKLLTVVGARPQFIKAAAVSRAIEASNADPSLNPIQEHLLHTGQHFDDLMSEVFFREMELRTPDTRFDVHSLPHGAMTGRMLEQIESVILSLRPDAVLVYGDTNSTLAGALAAAKCHVPLVHVEAGLRSGNRSMPEEINRILTDQVSDAMCCPTQTAVDHLEHERAYEHGTIVLTGDVMFDAALYYAEKAETMARLAPTLAAGGPFLLATLHRAENTDHPDRLASIIGALNRLHRDRRVLMPLHPRTRAVLSRTGLKVEFDTCEPLGYFDMLWLLKRCSLVLTDSGGLQKEAFFFSKPCVTLRDETEWVELVAGGFNRLAGASEEAVVKAVSDSWDHHLEWESPLYGNGNAGAEVVAAVRRLLSQHV